MTLLPIAPGLDSEVVGSKASTLGHMKGTGIAVPPGFVITGAPIDPEQISDAAKRLGTDSFAVRSSAIDEDGSMSSMAGRYESQLSVARDDIATAVASIRSSAGIEDHNRPMPVIVQQLVSADVSGVAFTADPVTGDRSTTVIDAVRGLGDQLMAGAVDGEEWVVTARRARRTRTAEPVMTRALARTVARTAKRVAKRLDVGPLDIEWSWDGRTLWIVQARPITGLAPQVSWDIQHRGVFHRGFRLGEWISEPITPLCESWLLTRLERRMHQIHRRQIGQLAPEPHHVVVNGWYFYSLNFLPVPGASLWRSLPRVLRLSLTTPRRVAVMFPHTVIAGYPLYEHDWRTDIEPRYRSAVEEARTRVESADADELFEIVDRLADLAGEYFASIAVVAGSAYKVETLLARFWNRHLDSAGEGSHLDLLSGLEDVQIEPNETLLASLDWFIAPVTAHAGADVHPGATRRRRLAAEAAARSALSGSLRRLRRFEHILAHAQHLQPVREAQMRGLAIAWPVMRRAVQRLGGFLERQGLLTARDQVFFLEFSELRQALAGGAVDVSLVAERQAAREESRRLVPPAWVGRMPVMTRVAFASTNRAFGARHAKDALVEGVPASTGIATGPVRIVASVSDFGAVRAGDVLVAPITAPAWTPLFAKAAAVVTDVGSGLAHASIIAREFGIPAVVGCGDATSRLRNDQVVTVDGMNGSVRAATLSGETEST